MKEVCGETQCALNENERKMLDEGLANARRTEPEAWRWFPAKIHPPVSFETEAGRLRILKEERLLLDEDLPLKGFQAKIKVHVMTLTQESHPPEERFIGYTKIYEWSVGYLKGWEKESYDLLEKHGFATEDTVADLALFYPLHEAKKLKRKGIGTAVMQHLIGESKSEGLAGFYIPMAGNEMREFLKSTEFEKASNEFYLKNFARNE